MTISTQELAKTLAELSTPAKGLLAADESLGTIEKLFKLVDVASTEETRRDYRELLFSTPGLGDYICGAILFEETLKQKSAAGMPLTELLKAQGIVPGIKVDKGMLPLPNFPGEQVTQGLDNLGQRLSEYKQLGARFAKWRAVINISAGIPSAQAIAVNAHVLARYAAICQEHSVVPIVEPEVLMEGDHTLATSARITEEVLHAVFHALYKERVALEYMILKPNMVEPGHSCPELATPQQVAQATLICLKRTVPAAVPMITFLSGGQSEAAATANLNALNSAVEKQPWDLRFSYGRALQASALCAWRGEATNKLIAQQELYKRARLNSAATQGKYTVVMEKE
jgi:fructose-bisphosphate aldolase, class I